MSKNEQSKEELLELIRQAQEQVIQAIASTYTVEQLQEALTMRQRMDAAVGTNRSQSDLSGRVDPFDTPASCSIEAGSTCGED